MVVWIGASLKIQAEEVLVSVKQQILVDIKRLIAEAELHNTYSIKNLRSLAGKCSHVASLVPTVKPLLTSLWGALTSTSPSHAPSGLVWIKQIEPSLRWLRAFLHEEDDALIRTFPLSAFRRLGPQLVT
eukprot:1877844-Amphidinium_carterae.1